MQIVRIDLGHNDRILSAVALLMEKQNNNHVAIWLNIG